MVKFGSLKPLKTLLTKGKKGLRKYYDFRTKLQKKALPLLQKGLNWINEAVIKNDNGVIRGIIEKVVPGGNYIGLAMDIVGQIIDTQMFDELAQILEKGDRGEYKNVSTFMNDLMKLAEKGKQTFKTVKPKVEDLKKKIKEDQKKKPLEIKRVNEIPKKIVSVKEPITDFFSSDEDLDDDLNSDESEIMDYSPSYSIKSPKVANLKEKIFGKAL